MEEPVGGSMSSVFAARHRVATNGITLTVHTAGPLDGPMVLLLHGFPECAHGWSRQVPALAEAGYFCVVPEQRGYADSDRPPRVRDYRLEHLCADALGVADHFGRARFHVVSHDWGGVVGWSLALDHAPRVASFTALNIPHPGVMLRHLATPGQLRKSWYIFAFQLPWLAERLLTVDRLTRLMFANTVTKPFTEDDLAAYRAAWTAPGAIGSMVAWYRAIVRRPRLPRNDRVTRPAMVVFGQRDLALDWRMAPSSVDRCDAGELHLLPDAAHFVQHDAPAEVNRLLLDFLGRHRGEPGTGPGAGVS
jgi:pimeloyl-ACP methyl ester carboxylesterase